MDTRAEPTPAAMETEALSMRQIVDGLPAPVIVVDRLYRVVYHNQRYLDLQVPGVTSLLGRTAVDLFSPDVVQHMKPFYERAFAGERADYRREHVLPNGQQRLFHVTLFPWRSGNGGVLGALVVGTDVTAERDAKAALEKSDSLFRAMTRLASDWYWEQDEHLRFTVVDGAFFQDEEWARDIIGKTRWELPTIDQDPEVVRVHDAAVAARQPFRDLVIKRPAHNGGIIYGSISGEPMFDSSGVFRGYRGVGKDVTPLFEAVKRAAFLADHDALTGLFNRRVLPERVTKAMAAATRERPYTGVLYVDLDQFKRINDIHGHALGDVVLAEIASRLQRLLRTGDSAFRAGGDQFVICAAALRHEREAGRVAEKVAAALTVPITIGGEPTVLTATIGIAVGPQDGKDANQLLRHAETAKDHAKRAARGSTQYFRTEMKLAADHQGRVEAWLRSALAAAQLTVHYQPRVLMADGRLLGFEALARGPEGEDFVTHPDEFILIAEESGLIHALGDVVLREAVRTVRDWRKRFGLPLTVSVNVSPKQLSQADFVVRMLDILREERVPPESVELEITESVLVDNLAAASHTLRLLREAGVRIALDDFGKGYSSLTYLNHLPLDTLKIERALVASAGDARGRALLKGVIALASDLGLEVCAEGVETATQWQTLTALRCDQAQGYYVQRPLSAEALETWYRGEIAGRSGD